MQKEGRRPGERTRKRRLEECVGEITFTLILEINPARELDLSLGFGNQFDLGSYKVKCALHITSCCIVVTCLCVFTLYLCLYSHSRQGPLW